MDKQQIINKRMKKARDARMAKLAEKGKETYLNEGWLFSRSCVDKMSLDQIADLCGVEYDVIWDALNQFGIPIIIMVGREEWNRWVKKEQSIRVYVPKGYIL